MRVGSECRVEYGNGGLSRGLYEHGSRDRGHYGYDILGDADSEMYRGRGMSLHRTRHIDVTPEVNGSKKRKKVLGQDRPVSQRSKRRQTDIHCGGQETLGFCGVVGINQEKPAFQNSKGFSNWKERHHTDSMKHRVH